MSILELVNVSKKFDYKYALHDCSIKIQPKQIIGYLGPNGAGKTTTIKIIASVLRQDQGQLYFRNKLIMASDYEYKQYMGFVLDEPIYYRFAKIFEFLNFVGTMYNVCPHILRDRIKETLSVFDLEECEKQAIRELSHGQQKKVLLAASLIHNPDLLILDEPLEGLDPVSLQIICKCLQNFVNNGKSVFLSSHRLDILQNICTDIVFLKKGKILFKGKVTNSKNDLAKLYFNLMDSSEDREKFSWI